MMTVKQLIESPCQSSPDGNYWEPALPSWQVASLQMRLRDIWAVWSGKAVAIRQTTKDDLTQPD
jgi:hypothetical protein